MLFTALANSCKKDHCCNSLSGQYQWIESTGGWVTITPPADSMVVINFIDCYNYSATLNGQVVVQGTYNISTESNYNVLHFRGFTRVSGLLLTDEIIETPDNQHLQLLDYPVHPEAYTSYFIKKVVFAARCKGFILNVSQLLRKS